MDAPREQDSAALGRMLDAWAPRPRLLATVKTPWGWLVAALLSEDLEGPALQDLLDAVLPALGDAQACASAGPHQVAEILRHVPDGRSKARALTDAARQIVRCHGGRVPPDQLELAGLAGLDRRAIATVQAFAFGRPGIVVGRHLRRISGRLGWVTDGGVAASEDAVARRFPADEWIRRSLQFERLGRSHCRAGRPHCDHCPIRSQCPRVGVDDA